MTVAFLGGRIYTGRRIVQAVLLESGRVVRAGRDETVQRETPTGATIVRLRGRVVLPGLLDAHMHVLGSSIRLAGVNLAGVRSVSQLQARLASWALAHARGPVIGNGWDQEVLKERRFPTASELDRAVPDRPVVIYRVCGHAAVVNSAALAELAQAARVPTPAPSPHRSRDGVLREEELTQLEPLRRLWLESNEASFRQVLDHASRLGLTSLCAMSVTYPVFQALERVSQSHPGIPDVHCYASVQQVDRFRGSVPIGAKAPVRWVGIKVVVDGSLGARTAALNEDYADLPGEKGSLRSTVGEDERISAEADAEGLQVALHAIGDAAVGHVLRWIRSRRPRVRSRIEHASVLSESLVKELSELRPYLVVQPSFAVSDVWIQARLGRARARWAYPFRTLLESGVVLAGSSDSPVEAMDPWTGMRAATTPDRAVGLRKGERLTSSAALGLYTAGAVLGDSRVGSLEEGAPADLVRLTDVSLDSALDRGRLTVVETWKNGERVFARRPAAGRGGPPGRAG